MRSLGFGFNYSLNSTCLDNKEFTREGQKKLKRLLTWLRDIGITQVTVAMPYLFRFVKENFPSFKISVSSGAYVNSLSKVKFWERLGADRITLLPTELNRCFPILERIRENTKVELQLIANNGCLLNCPFYFSHCNLLSHASQQGHHLKGFFIDFYALSCRFIQLSQPVNFMASDWIRPEDICYYEEIGYHDFKLVDREMPSERILLIVKVYLERKYEGNLLDILGNFSSATDYKDLDRFMVKKKIRAAKFFLQPCYVNVFKLLDLRKILVPAPLYIENEALNGFIEYFKEGKCNLECERCEYCKSWAQKVIRIKDHDKYQTLLKHYEGIINNIVEGNIFRYLGKGFKH